MAKLCKECDKYIEFVNGLCKRCIIEAESVILKMRIPKSRRDAKGKWRGRTSKFDCIAKVSLYQAAQILTYIGELERKGQLLKSQPKLKINL